MTIRQNWQKQITAGTQQEKVRIGDRVKSEKSGPKKSSVETRKDGVQSITVAAWRL